jgi:hypothetical protein
VVLRAEPTNAALEALPIGGSAVSTPVAKALVGSSGSFELRVKNVRLLSEFADTDSIITFSVMSATTDSFTSYPFSRSLVINSSGATLVDPVSVDSDDPLQPHSPNAPKFEIEGTEPEASVQAAGVSAAAAAAAPMTQICGETKVADYAPVWVAVGGVILASTGTQGKMTYLAGARSALGVGVSATGKIGTYKKSGTTVVTATDKINYTMKTGPSAWAYQTKFRYGKFGFWCYPVGQPQAKSTYQYSAKAYSYISGSAKKQIAKPNAPYCTTMDAGDSVEKDWSVAYEWKTGVDIGSYLGIDLNITTGYSHEASVYYENTSTKPKPYCGEFMYPGETPGRIVLG